MTSLKNFAFAGAGLFIGRMVKAIVIPMLPAQLTSGTVGTVVDVLMDGAFAVGGIKVGRSLLK